ncbi:DUF2515 family protein [Sediminibacillus massiliensis]|uniref:DUF2515 family protein n=1 Tax=Sediminibacillus massiliensis TaxID=1926277 RepID=UPI0015C3AD2D|nr:DUF2515 family protein [Sediminibacillus massiliensis]
MDKFGSLEERIETGKKLYAILFGLKEVFNGTTNFAKQIIHSGSRADYWPCIFSKTVGKGTYQKERIIGTHLKKGAEPIYSPELEKAWKDQVFFAPKRVDWCKDLSALDYFTSYKIPSSFDITTEYANSLNKIEAAVLLKENLK